MPFVLAAGLAVFGLAGQVASSASAPRAPLRVTLTFDDALKDHILIAAPLLEAHGWRGTFNVVVNCVDADESRLTWDDVRELVRRGHEVATHTMTHPHLASMLKQGKKDEVRREIADSRDAIARKTGVVPRFMCSPFTDQNEETAQICREEGLRQMLPARHNFGEENADTVRQVVERELQRGGTRLDILSHGISAADHGGWCPFKDKAQFARHLETIAALEREGKIVVTDYEGMVSDCPLDLKAWPRHGKLDHGKR